MEQFEDKQMKISRQIQDIPSQAANTAFYVLIGAIPAQLVMERSLNAIHADEYNTESKVPLNIRLDQLLTIN